MSDWLEHRLDNITDGTPITYGVVQPGPEDPNGILFIRGGDISQGRIKISELRTITNKISNQFKRTILKGGELLVSLVGNPGEVAIVSENLCGANIARQVGMIRFNIKIADPYFFQYFFMTSIGHSILNANTIGSVQNVINLKELKAISVPLPKIEEQREISKIFLIIDKKIDLLRRQNETLEQIAQSLFKRWFVDFEFPDENGRPYKSSGGEMVASELDEIPVGWSVSNIGNEVKILGGGTPSTKESSYWENGNIIWYTPSDLTKHTNLFSLSSERKITKIGLQNSSANLFPPYSLMMTSRATIGEIAINTEESCTNQGFIVLVPNEQFSIYYLHGWLLTQLKMIQILASGSTFPEISRSVFKKFNILKVPNEINLNFDSLIQPLYRKIEINIREYNNFESIRDVLLPKLMSGQIQVK